MMDDFARTIADLQGVIGELVCCAVASRRTDEVRPQLDRCIERTAHLAADFRRRADLLDNAVRVCQAYASITQSNYDDKV